MTSAPLTLMQMAGAPLHPSPLDRASLVLVDLQEEYRTGALALPEVHRAVAGAAAVLALARERGVPVFHVVHETGAGAPVFAPGRPGSAILGEVAPRDDEARVVKHLPDAFAGTDLHARLRATGRPELILVGAMTHMCVSATARAALDLGFRATVVADACATRDLPGPGPDGGVIPAAEVHRTALAELADAFAVVVPDTSSWAKRSSPT